MEARKSPGILGAAPSGASRGIVSLVLTTAGQYHPSRPATMMGRMTVAYGLAEVGAALLVKRPGPVTSSPGIRAASPYQEPS